VGFDGQSPAFKLLGLLEKARARIRKRGRHSGGAVAAHNEAAAERIVCWLGGRTGMPVAISDPVIWTLRGVPT
jgi:hypothetical protein